MSFESLGLPIRCPQCQSVIAATESTCPDCGYSIKRSAIEEEAWRYKQQYDHKVEQRSAWAKGAYLLLTLFIIIGCIGLSEEYGESTNRAASQETLEILIASSIAAFVFLSLTILCFFKPMAASITGLIIYSAIMGLALIGLYTDGGLDSLLSIYTLLMLIFPAAMIKTIYDLRQVSQKS